MKSDENVTCGKGKVKDDLEKRVRGKRKSERRTGEESKREKKERQ